MSNKTSSNYNNTGSAGIIVAKNVCCMRADDVLALRHLYV